MFVDVWLLSLGDKSTIYLQRLVLFWTMGFPIDTWRLCSGHNIFVEIIIDVVLPGKKI